MDTCGRPGRRTPPRRYLMCPPTYFTVCYRINPWMHPEQPVDPVRAQHQWQRLHDHLVLLGHEVELVPARSGLPDMVFAANGGLLIGNRALVPRFRHPQRAGEAEHFAAIFRSLGVSEIAESRRVNEGEGDFLPIGEQILAGTGPRTDAGAVEEVADFFGIPVVPLTLVDARFYHLDTALGRLDDHTVAYWPGAFDLASQGVLRDLFPDAIIASEADAAALALNLVSDGSTVITARSALAGQIADRGYDTVLLCTDELGKSGRGREVLRARALPAGRVTRHSSRPPRATRQRGFWVRAAG